MLHNTAVYWWIIFFSVVGHNIISFCLSICRQWEHTRARRSHLTHLLHLLFRTQLPTRYTNIWLLTLFSQTAVKWMQFFPLGSPACHPVFCLLIELEGRTMDQKRDWISATSFVQNELVFRSVLTCRSGVTVHSQCQSLSVVPHLHRHHRLPGQACSGCAGQLTVQAFEIVR